MLRVLTVALVLSLTCGLSKGTPPKEFTNTIGMKFIHIPAGEFAMGAPKSDLHALEDEQPQHTVRITRPFYLGVTEVTQTEYAEVMGYNPSVFAGVSRPVERVSWDNVVAFCKMLAVKEGLHYRLPTEAEWEYACRAGSTTQYSFGDAISLLGEHAWFKDNAGKMTHPVGKKKPNAWGLYDMHGNVMEWCSDSYESDYYRWSPSVDPSGPASAFSRVCRGGHHASSARNCRSTSRYQFPSAFHTYALGWIGFRVAVDLDHIDTPSSGQIHENRGKRATPRNGSPGNSQTRSERGG